MARYGNVYEEFDKIVLENYSLEKICLMNEAADRMFYELDVEIAENLEWDSTSEFGKSVEDVYDELYQNPYDQEMDWDFPEPPEI